MERLVIKGGRPLEGVIPVSGAKNAALPLMVAGLLTDEPLTLRNVPHLADIRLMIRILEQHGAAVERAAWEAGESTALTLTAKRITSTTAPYDLVRKMRASFLVTGPLLARCGEATVSLPGGCAIGTRPVDLHLKGLEALGADIRLRDGYVHAFAPRGLRGARIAFPFVSVGATENLLMAASLAQGVTVLENAAREPEIIDLACCLQTMGADIEGAGTDTITVNGMSALNGGVHDVLPDRIETGTFAMAASVVGGDLELIGARADLISAVIPILRRAGVDIGETERGLRVARNGGRHTSVDVTTEPYPGFPTDLQAQLMALMCTAEGTSRIKETIFENRFMHVPELLRMGADISVQGQTAVVSGVEKLRGAPVMATDLRASVGLVLAGLAADGETVINRLYHLDRGFERLEEKLGACGAQIRRIEDRTQRPGAPGDRKDT
ncbi:MAG: UDP-N-acetylglucosamine 1-carboxyvinyltransferase [Alphaproteobacteria bacterium]